MSKRPSLLVVLAIIPFLPGCYFFSGGNAMPVFSGWGDALTFSVLGGVSKSSPAQAGFGGQFGVPLSSSDTGTLIALGSYEFSSWDGGHDNVFSFGLQSRSRWGQEANARGVGAEVIYHRWICKSEDLGFCGNSPAANGLGINGLFVQPVADGAFNR